MLKIGITGGIGSGKSTVATIFRVLGIQVFNADTEARWLMQHEPQLKNELIQAFGNKSFDQTGQLDRKYIAAQVFGNHDRLQTLNSLVHPAVQHHFEQWARRQDSMYVMKEAALLFESGSDTALDGIIAVSAPEHERLKRAMERDGADEEAIKRRMKGQWPQNKIVALANWVIENDGQTMLIPQVLNLHRQFLTQSSVNEWQ